MYESGHKASSNMTLWIFLREPCAHMWFLCVVPLVYWCLLSSPHFSALYLHPWELQCRHVVTAATTPFHLALWIIDKEPVLQPQHPAPQTQHNLPALVLFWKHGLNMINMIMTYRATTDIWFGPGCHQSSILKTAGRIINVSQKCRYDRCVVTQGQKQNAQ